MVILNKASSPASLSTLPFALRSAQAVNSKPSLAFFMLKTARFSPSLISFTLFSKSGIVLDCMNAVLTVSMLIMPRAEADAFQFSEADGVNIQRIAKKRTRTAPQIISIFLILGSALCYL